MSLATTPAAAAAASSAIADSAQPNDHLASKPLTQLFFDALATLAATDPYPTDAATLQARDTLLHCSRRIRSAHLFSPNEDWDDIATSNLPLLLTDAYLADAEARVRTFNPRDRRAALARVVGHWHAYLTNANRLGLASAGDVAMADVASFGMDQISGGGGNAATRRNEKIARFKAAKERQARMASLNETLAAAAQRKASSTHRPMLPASFLASVTSGFSSLAPREATPSTGGGNKFITRSGEGDDEDDELDDDEVLSRDFVKLLLTHWVDKAKDELEMVRDELPMVQRMIQAAEGAAATAGAPADGARDPQRTRGRNEDDLAARLDGVRLGGTPAGNGLLDAQGRPMRPFTLVSQRAVEQGKVFRPSHRLPTMSIEEYIDAEMERGGILPTQDPGDQKEESDSDDDEVADRRTYKKREWDAFTDDNPRGAGNRNWNRG